MKKRAHHRNEMPLEKQQMFIKQVNIVISMSRLLGFDTFANPTFTQPSFYTISTSFETDFYSVGKEKTKTNVTAKITKKKSKLQAQLGFI